VALANPRQDLDAIAFRNPDAGVVVVAMNRTDVPVQLSVTVGDDGASGELPAHAILTLEWPARPPGGGT
jgi:O-glycosyl hydrolase